MDLLKYLPSERSDKIRQIAEAVGQQPRRQALPIYVRELKFLIHESRQNPFEKFDPEWLAEFLAPESPRIISAILSQFPRSAAEKIFYNLPPHVQRRLPKMFFPLQPELAKRLNRLFSQKFSLFFPKDVTKLSLESLSALETKDLFTLLRELGLNELALAFSNVGKGPLTELCRRLGNPEANLLLEKLRNLHNPSREEIKSAQRTISMLSLHNLSQSAIIEEIGLGKLCEAIKELPQECKQSIALRLPRRLGIRIKSHQGLKLQPNDLFRLQKEVIETIQKLSAEGKISKHWSTLEVQLPPPPPSPEEEKAGEPADQSHREGESPPEDSEPSENIEYSEGYEPSE